jgi:hypothetical protein
MIAADPMLHHAPLSIMHASSRPHSQLLDIYLFDPLSASAANAIALLAT